MASFTIQFRAKVENRIVVKDVIQVIGSKMSDSFMRKHYGKNWREEEGELFRVSKPNKYSIKWVNKSEDKLFGTCWNVCAEQSIPYDVRVIQN